MTPDYSDDEAGSDLERAATPRRSSTPTQSRVASRQGGQEETQSIMQSMIQPDPPQYDNLDWQGDLPETPREPERVAIRIPQEQAPPYESPTASGAPQLGPFLSLPAIEITPTTPWSPVARES